MKVYIEVETGQYPLTDEDIKKMFPSVSFSNPFMAPAGFELVHYTTRPRPMPYQQMVERAPVFDGEKWVQVWEVVDAPAEVIAERAAKQWSSIRVLRDKKLQKTDWIVSVSDSPLTPEETEEWLTYRQALRDVTKGNDPWSFTWPREPGSKGGPDVGGAS